MSNSLSFLKKTVVGIRDRRVDEWGIVTWDDPFDHHVHVWVEEQTGRLYVVEPFGESQYLAVMPGDTPDNGAYFADRSEAGVRYLSSSFSPEELREYEEEALLEDEDDYEYDVDEWAEVYGN